MKFHYIHPKYQKLKDKGSLTNINEFGGRQSKSWQAVQVVEGSPLNPVFAGCTAALLPARAWFWSL